MRRAILVLVVTSVSVLAGCSGSAKEGCGELEWAEGGTALSVDLTTFASCEQPMRALELRNAGACAVEFDTPEHASGAAVSFGPTFGEATFFRVDVGASRIEPGESVTVTVVRNVWADAEAKQATVRLRGTHGESASLELEALPNPSAWDGVPEQVDFGSVMRGDEATAQWELRNPTQLTATFRVDAPKSSGGEAPFSFAGEMEAGEVVIGPDASQVVPVRFAPEEVGSFLALQRVTLPPCEGERTVKLVGEGVSSVLSWSPAQLDCGYVAPGSSVTREVTFSNVGAVPVELSQIKLLNAKEFRVVAPPGTDPQSLSVPAATRTGAGEWQAGTAILKVACEPATVGLRQTQLTFATSVPRQPAGVVSVKVFGGGPDIEVSPSPNLNFGKVAYFGGVTPPVFQKRVLTVENVGTAPSAPDPNANLHLDPVITVTPLNGATSASEFQVSFPSTYDFAEGLVARAGMNRVDLEVMVTPTSVGLKQAELLLKSNDPDEPEVKVLLSADAIVLPPCLYSVSPTPVSFGRMSPPDVRDLVFEIKNEGTNPGDVCLLSGLRLTPGSHASFSLVDGPIVHPVEMAPGERKQIRVRASPTTATYPPTNAAGHVEFYMSSPSKPVTQVSLVAELGESCLTIAPHTLDFGVAKTGCSSATRQVRVYNRCPGAITLDSVGTASSEFTLTGAPSGVTLTAGDPPVTFDVTYAPSGAGRHSGVASLAVNQSGNIVTYQLPLVGEANATGIATESFGTSARKLDLLMVLQDSLSVWQTGLSTEMPSFVQYAQQLGLDYRVAVTTMDMSGGAAQGRFVSGTGHPAKVVSPQSSTPASQLSNKVLVGTSGSAFEQCFAPAVAALSAPLAHLDNAGFLRPEASLAVVCVGMEKDQSPDTHGWYLDVLRNLKAHARPSLFTFSAVNGFSPACNIDDGRLAAAADATGGLKHDLCAPNWQQFLKDLADLEARPRTVFELRAEPDLQQGSISVTIDGVNVPAARGGVTAWSYDPTKRQVVLGAAFVPDPGKAVVVEYPVVCHP